jgi:hypothetical protein
MRRSALISAFLLLPFANALAQSRTPSQQPEREIVAVFTTMAGCCETLVPMLKPSLDSMRMFLAAEAARRGATFKIVGVSLDWEPEIGWEHLKKYGRFDEVTVGGNWMNMSAEMLIFQDTSSHASVHPQVLVYEHTITWNNDRVVFGPRRTLARIVEIPQWVRAGAPIPK